MAAFYTVESVDGGMEVRLSREHQVRCRVWMCDDVATRFLGQLSAEAEARLREQMREEYDAVLSRLIALMRGVLSGQPGGSIEMPDEAENILPFFNSCCRCCRFALDGVLGLWQA